MLYRIDFECNDEEQLQNMLNRLYEYKDDISTKVFHRNRMNLFYLLMKKLIERNVIENFDSALDVGCNRGIYSKIISDFGFKRVLGIDLVDEMIKKANDFFAFKESGKHLEYRISDAEDLNTDEKYDFILCTEVIEHTDNPAAIIEKIKNILAPGGVAVITLPNSISLSYIFIFLSYRLRNKRMDKDLRQHLKYPFYRSVRLFTDDNLKVVKTSGTNLILNGVILRFLYGWSIFPTINKINFHLSKLWPLKYLSQFFFIVVKRNSGRTEPRDTQTYR